MWDPGIPEPKVPAILPAGKSVILKGFHTEGRQDVAGTGPPILSTFRVDVSVIRGRSARAAGKYIGRTGGQVTDAQGYSLDFWKLLFNLGFRKGLRTAKQSENIQVKIGGLIHTITLSVADKVIVAHREESGNAVGKSGQENYGNY